MRPSITQKCRLIHVQWSLKNNLHTTLEDTEKEPVVGNQLDR